MKVLLTTDGSPDSLHAIHEAVRLLPLATAEVAVVAVANPMAPLPSAGLGSMGTVMVAERLEELALVDLEAAKGVLAGHGIHATVIERMGDPATVIDQVGHELGADVIVVGAHGSNAIERFLLGSVSDALAHRWHGALLVIQPARS